jgi:SAM-dependent methyltransferase
MLKRKFLQFVRAAGLMPAFDTVYFQYNRMTRYRRNKAFVDSHPDLALPPGYLVYESYQMDYKAYFEDGRDTAAWVVSQLSAVGKLDGKWVLDWGCGPARVVRHLPGLIDANLFATDYNRRTIGWCRSHIAGVAFDVNDVAPPTAYAPESFDAVYGLSVFTHLSAERHVEWAAELRRILKPRGALLITTHGDAFRAKLGPEELKCYGAGQLVERGRVAEGHRAFSAYHPPAFIRELFHEGWDVFRHTPGKQQSWGPEQDTWIFQKL